MNKLLITICTIILLQVSYAFAVVASHDCNTYGSAPEHFDTISHSDGSHGNCYADSTGQQGHVQKCTEAWGSRVAKVDCDPSYVSGTGACYVSMKCLDGHTIDTNCGGGASLPASGNIDWGQSGGSIYCSGSAGVGKPVEYHVVNCNGV